MYQNSSQKDCGRMDQVISLEIQERGEKNEEKQKRKETVKDNGFGCSIDIFDIHFDIRNY